jgi:FtsP/CotA-like multicopper oxidase with cupredoxin domain
MRTLEPGQSLVYQFKADYAGVWMYHCGTAPALHHIGNGMFGAVIIDPPNLPSVDHEYLMVQSELYLGPSGQPGDLKKMQAVKPDAIVFNGFYNQYKFQPVTVNPGDRVRVWVLDAGPSENSAFHIVGTIFDTVYKEGSYLLRPDATHGGSQVLDLQPAQGGFVEFTLNDEGSYPMVTHKFANVGKGALGLFQVGNAAAMNHLCTKTAGWTSPSQRSPSPRANRPPNSRSKTSPSVTATKRRPAISSRSTTSATRGATANSSTPRGIATRPSSSASGPVR